MWHLSRFHPSEIIDLATKVEEKGVEFYKRLADKVSEGKTKEVLLFLASEEEQHQADFKRIGRELEPVNPRETYSGEYVDYLKSTVETHMFADEEWMEKIIETAPSEKDIIRLAASFEKDSILFLSSFKNLMPETKKGVIQDLINEEEGHLVRLAEIKRSLNGEGKK